MGIFYSRPDLIAARAEWKQAGKTVVFTNGCYDLIHPGHIRLLEQARSLGDILVLALNSDDSVRRLKGPSRPLIREQDRADVAVKAGVNGLFRRIRRFVGSNDGGRGRHGDGHSKLRDQCGRGCHGQASPPGARAMPITSPS